MTAIQGIAEAVRPKVALVDNDGAEVGINLVEQVADVTVFTDPVVAADEIEQEHFDLVVSDLVMPRLNGVLLLKRLIDSKIQAKLVVRSGFFATSEAADRAFFERHNIEVSDKLTVGAKHFYESICHIITGQNEANQQEEGLSDLPDRQPSILDMEYDEFQKFSQEDRFLAVELARDTIGAEVDQAFNDGAIWYLYGGRERKPLTAKNFKEIPNREEIQSFCKERNIPVVQYFRGAEIDDVLLEWREKCSESVQNYPLIGLSPNGDAENTLPVHFDTGSPVSFADFDVLNGFFADLPDRTTVDLAPFPVNGKTLQVTHERINVYFMDVNGVSPKVEINFIVPKDWEDFPNRRRICGSDCSRRSNEAGPKKIQQYGAHDHEGRTRYYCRFRWGLIGREFVLENELRLVLDGRKRIVHLLEDEE